MKNNSVKEVRWLRTSVLVNILLCSFVLFLAFVRIGKPRLQLVVDASGAARIEFLDENGQVAFSLPDSAKDK